MKAGKSLQELAAELERQNEAKKDFIVDAGAMSMAVDNDVPSLHVANGENSIPTSAAASVKSMLIAEFARFFSVSIGFLYLYKRFRTKNEPKRPFFSRRFLNLGYGKRFLA